MMVDNIVLFLMQLKGMGRKTIYRYFHLEPGEYSLEDIQDILKEGSAKTKKVSSLSRQELEAAYGKYEQVIENSSKLGIKITSYLDGDFPVKLRKTDDPPAVIYTLGDIGILNEKAVAVIGTREPIEYGARVVREPGKVRGRIGFLTSELKLEECFTPDYLFDFFSDLHGVDRERREKRKEELFARFGIDRYAQVKAASLSTGMKQKVSLVVSIVHDPDIIIFDEPTNGLDVLTARVVTDFLQQLRDQGKTIIVSTHIFSLIEKLCDRVGVIINGRMVLCDALDRVTAGESLEDRFFEIYRETVGDGV